MHFFSPDNIILTFGLLGAGVIVFLESGLFFAFFLPGDTLLFSAGIFSAQGFFPFWLMFFVLVIAGILGGQVGYLSGKKMGKYWFEKKESFFFKRGYMEKAENFYKKYGILTIVIARFVPIVRTFAPIIAGIIKMNRRDFFVFNVLGVVLWVFLISGLGFFLGQILPKSFVLHIALFAFILASVLTPFLPQIIKKFFL